MTNDAQQFYGGQTDLLTLSKGFVPIQQKGPFNNASITPAPGNPNVLRVELNFRNLSGGDGHGFGIISPYRFDTGGDMDKTFVTDHTDKSVGGYCTIGPSEAAGATWQNSAAVCSTVAFSTMVMGGGSIANHALLKSTNTTSSGLTEITYTPGSQIISLNDGTGLGSTAEKLFIGRVGAGVHVLSDLTTGGPTVYGTMNAATAQCWGLVFSPLNASTPGTPTLVIFAGTTISTLSAAAAVGDAPTTVATGLNAGGYIIKGSTDGIVELPNLPPRIFFWKPEVSSSSAAIAGGTTLLSQARGRIMHCNLEGTDVKELVTSLGNRVIWAVNYNNSIVASDGIRVIQVATNEEDVTPLREWNHTQGLSGTEGNPNTLDQILYIHGFSVAQGGLYVWLTESAQTATILVARLEPSQESQASILDFISLTPTNITGTDVKTAATLGPWPFSPQSQYLYFLPSMTAGNAQHAAHYLPPPGWPWYWWQLQQSSLSNSTFSRTTSPQFVIDGVNGWPMIVEEIVWSGEIYPTTSYSAAAFYRIDVASHSSTTGLSFAGVNSDSGVYAKFFVNDPILANHRRFADNTDAVNQFRYRLVVSASGNSDKRVFNQIPVTFRLLAFKDGNVTSPRNTTGAWYTYSQ